MSKIMSETFENAVTFYGSLYDNSKNYPQFTRLMTKLKSKEEFTSYDRDDLFHYVELMMVRQEKYDEYVKKYIAERKVSKIKRLITNLFKL